MSLLRIVFMSMVFCALGTSRAAEAAPTKVSLLEGKQEAGQVVVAVMIDQNDPSLRPVLADLRINYESAALRFVRAESADPQKAALGAVINKDQLRLTMTGFSLGPVKDGVFARLIFESVGDRQQALIEVDEAASKVAPARANAHLKTGPALRVVITRRGGKGS